MGADEFKVHAVQELKKRANRAEARQLLERISKQVQPILRKRGWVVPILKEFFPGNPRLLGLNVNGGRGRTTEIRIRLRPAHAPDAFLEYHDLLGTMLHEITHNVRGPHDKTFYTILDELTAECEELMAKGVSGSGVGFDGPSAGRLGLHAHVPCHNPPETMKRSAALKAAQKRAAAQGLMPAGPQRLGGKRAPSDPASVRAACAAAAERRARDNRWCPTEALAAGSPEAQVIILEGLEDVEGERGASRIPSDVATAAAAVPYGGRGNANGAVAGAERHVATGAAQQASWTQAGCWLGGGCAAAGAASAAARGACSWPSAVIVVDDEDECGCDGNRHIAPIRASHGEEPAAPCRSLCGSSSSCAGRAASCACACSSISVPAPAPAHVASSAIGGWGTRRETHSGPQGRGVAAGGPQRTVLPTDELCSGVLVGDGHGAAVDTGGEGRGLAEGRLEGGGGVARGCAHMGCGAEGVADFAGDGRGSKRHCGTGARSATGLACVPVLDVVDLTADD